MTRILIADDDDDIRRLVEMYLTGENQSVVATVDGAEALRAYGASLREGRPFALVILDCAMPNRSGTVVAERIRELGDPVPIVLMTAVSRSLIADDVVSLEIADVFEKPFALESFGTRVRELAGQNL